MFVLSRILRGCIGLLLGNFWGVEMNSMKQIIVVLLMALSSLAFASSPTVDQVYQVARSGNLEQAHHMMEQVISEHPNSAKAYFVDAEILASMGNKVDASQQLARAEKLDPALGFAAPASVQHLKQQLESGSSTYPNNHQGSGFSAYLPFVLLLAVIVIAWMVYRNFRNRTSASCQAYGQNYGSGYGAPMSQPPQAASTGSGIMGSLATGAALGAGMVAGEALAENLIGGHRSRESNGFQEDRYPDSQPSSSDLGGNDFGVTDSSGWDSGNDSGGW